MSELEKLKHEKDRLEAELNQKKRQEYLEKEAKPKDYLYKLQAGNPETVNQFMIERT